MTDEPPKDATISASSARQWTDVLTWFAGPTAVLLVISTFVAWGSESFQAQTGSFEFSTRHLSVGELGTRIDSAVPAVAALAMWIAAALLLIVAFVGCGRRRSLWLCAPVIAIAGATVAMLAWVRHVTADETDNAQTTAGVTVSIAVCAGALLVACWAAGRRPGAKRPDHSAD